MRLAGVSKFGRWGGWACSRGWPSICALVVVGCSGPQSSLDPAGPSAASIHLLGLMMYAGATVVTLLVAVLMLVPFLRRRTRAIDSRLFLWGGGVALPALTLTALVPYVMSLGHEARAPGTDRLMVDVTGHQYWWEISYARADRAAAIASANELRLPVGEPVELRLASSDVIHSLWIPSLAGKLDLVPGRVTRMTIQADRPGVYRGQCAEFCGTQHALMGIHVVAMERGAFDDWISRLAQPVPEPPTPELRKGMELFLEFGCSGCHTIRGITESPVGPDLTQIGARQSIGAGALPGGRDGIAHWIAGSDEIKPGNAMPPFDFLEDSQVQAIAAYLDWLK